MVYFTFSNVEEGEQVLEELLPLITDYKKKQSGTEPTLKKKAKKNSEEDPTKWIKVLTEIFIQLLTKSQCKSFLEQ